MLKPIVLAVGLAASALAAAANPIVTNIFPADPAARDDLLLRVMGSPDARQGDGVGGATPLTSKVAIVSRSTEDGVDLDYLFVQQKFAPLQNKYTISTLGPDGKSPAHPLAYVQQKRMKIREQIEGDAYLAGPYRMVNYRCQVSCVMTNKTPTGTVRAASATTSLSCVASA